MDDFTRRLAETKAKIAEHTRDRDVARRALGDAIVANDSEKVAKLERAIATHEREIDRAQLAASALDGAVLLEHHRALEAEAELLRQAGEAEAEQERESRKRCDELAAALDAERITCERLRLCHARQRARSAFDRVSKFYSEHADKIESARQRFAVTAGR